MTDVETFSGMPGDDGGARESIASREPAARLADAVRALAFDAAEEAGSDDLAFALGMAEAATQLWVQPLKFDAADPRWPDRDRCVVSAGRGAALARALSCLTGLGPAGDGTETAGIEGAVNGPPGQGLAVAVGMALAERLLAARFGKSLVDHRTWALACAGELHAGLSHEAVCLAGQQRLEKLTVLLADDGEDGDALRHFTPHGWAAKQVDAGDPAELAAALSSAARSKKPSAIVCRLRPQSLARADLGWPDQAFGVPGPLRARWLAAGSRGAAARRGWIKRLARHPMRAEFERVVSGRAPESWREAVAAMRAGGLSAADLFRSPVGPVSELVAIWAANESGAAPARCVNHGGRPAAMAAAMNGLAIHGGLIPCGRLPLAAADVLQPSLRLAGRMRLRSVHALHEREDDPPERLAALRAMPNVVVMRPAGLVETAECWDVAVRRADGPSVIVLPACAPEGGPGTGGCACGGYVVAEAVSGRDATLIASGAELAVAARARDMLAERGIDVALVSLPCWELFEAQDQAARLRVLGAAPRFGIEAGSGFGWERWLGVDGVFIGSAAAGLSPSRDYGYSVISEDAVCTAVVKRLRC